VLIVRANCPRVVSWIMFRQEGAALRHFSLSVGARGM
jgi:hypothetical protein